MGISRVIPGICMVIEMKKRIRNSFIILVGSAIIGILLLLVVFLLPVNSAREHVKESIYPMIDVKDDDMPDPKRMQVREWKENFTDSLMVQNALERVEGKSVIEHAMYIYHYDLGDDTTWMTEDSLSRFVKQGTDGLYLREYSKYWHGYLVWLKPLLMCMSWETLEVFWAIVQILFLIFVVVLSFRKKQGIMGIGILCALFFMKPVRIWISFAMCVCWGITLLALMGLLLWYRKLEKKNYSEEYFLLIGVLTAYMDFLTYPIVTVGIPLCLYLVFDQEVKLKWWKRIRKIFWLGMLWGVGYIGMWGLKWVFAEILCQSGTLRNAVWSVIYRTSPLDGYHSAFSGISRTITAVLGQYDSVVYHIVFAGIVVATVVSLVWCFIKARSENWGTTIFCLAVVAVLPFIWLAVTQNHTAIHCGFTFRIMGVSVFALWCMIVSSVRTIKRKKSEHEN